MKIRPAMSGLALDEAMSQVVEVTSRKELIEHLQKHFDFWQPTDENVTVEPYGNDDRNGWDTHLVCVAGKAALFADGPCPGMNSTDPLDVSSPAGQVWVLFEIPPNGTRLLRGIYTAPERAQKGLDTIRRLYEAGWGRSSPEGFYVVLPGPLDTLAWP